VKKRKGVEKRGESPQMVAPKRKDESSQQKGKITREKEAKNLGRKRGVK